MYKQSGKSTYFRKRDSNDSMININKSLKSQINLIRICDDKKFPAFFKLKDKKFILKMRED